MSAIIKSLPSLVSKSVLVTGGASGLGATTAKFLAEKGAKVTVLDMNEKGNDVAKDIGGKFVRANLAEAKEVEDAIHAATEAYGPLFGLVNCAAVLHFRELIGKRGVHPLQEFEHVIKVNLVGAFNVCRLAADSMASANVPESEDRGVIINVGSIAGYDGQPGQTAYAASKGGIHSLTLPLARELGSFRIRVNTICPGMMDTPMIGDISSEVMEMATKSVPYPCRKGRPVEFASLVHHVMVNSYINGECIRIDGAMRPT